MNEKPEPNRNYIENDLEIVYSILHPRYAHLINLKKNEKQTNKKNIFNIIQSKNGVTTSEIHNILEKYTKIYNSNIEDKAQREYDNGRIKSHKEKENYIKKYTRNTIGIRTIQIIVKELQKQNLIIKQTQKFYARDDLEINSPYIAEKYGKMILEKILKQSNFYSEKQLIQDLVNKFGLILLFNFITAIKDIRDCSVDKIIDNLYEDDAEIVWLKSVISIENMYSYFKTLIERFEKQNTSEGNIPLLKKLSGIMESDYHSIFSNLSEIKNQFT